MADIYTRIGYIKGATGAQGERGLQGDPGEAATIEVGSVTTVPYGQTANVTNSGTESAAIFDFQIPQGRPGEQVTDMQNLTIGAITTSSASFPVPAVGETGKVLWGKVVKWFSDMAALVATKLNASNVVNNLTTTSSGYALDARQGKVLNDFLAIHEVSISDSVNANLTVTQAKIIKSGRVCQIYLAATAKAALAPWTVLVYGVPDGYKPFETANAYGITIDGNREMANMNGSGTVNTIVSITNGASIRFTATYITV